MKVAYNECYGGFGLSQAALKEFAKRKGVKLFFYEQSGCDEFRKVKASADSFAHAVTRDLGEITNELPTDVYYYKGGFEDERTDPDLIAVIEEMGKDANGSCANLKIARIPDGAQFEIDNYDGFESVVPPRQSW